MGKIIACTNQKGGVGKTTTAINLAASLGLLGHRTLLVDLDPQANSTSGAGLDKSLSFKSVYEVLLGSAKPAEAVYKTNFENLYILPASMSLAGAEIELVNIEKRESRLRQALGGLRENFDFIIIDCPPSLGLLTLNGLNAADTIIIPLQCEFFALEGLSQLINTVRQVKSHFNPTLELEGILFTMYDGRLLLTNQVVAEIKKHFPKKIYKNIIPRNVKLSEAPSFGMPAYYYDKGSKGAQAYIEFATELLSKQV